MAHIFQGEQIPTMPSFVLCAKVQRLLEKGYVAWIIVMSEKETNDVDISKVFVVNEFLDVFHEELLSYHLIKKLSLPLTYY